MTSIFDKWTDLDHSLALRRIEAAHGSAVFDRFSYLDPERAIHQIEAALSCNLDDVRGVLNISSLSADIDASLSGGGVYNAKGVHFDGNTWLAIASLLASDNIKTMSASFWTRVAALTDNSYAVIFAGNPGSQILENYIYIEFDDPVNNIFFSTGNVRSIEFPSMADTPIAAVQWTNVLLSCDTSNATDPSSLPHSSKIGHFYFNDIDANAAGYVHEGTADGAPFNLNFNGLPFAVGSDTEGGNLLGDLADVWIAPGQFIDFSIEENRRKFIDANGKPVNLGSDGSTPTGSAPAVYFSGDAATFAVNRGNGGASTVAGTLTNATTSPSD